MAERPVGISARQAAAIKGVTVHSVYKRIATGKLPAVRWEGRWVIRREDLGGWIVVGHNPPKPRPPR